MIPQPRNVLPVSFVTVATPATETDPNTAALTITNPRVIVYDPRLFFAGAGVGQTSILDGTSLTGRWWMYDTTSSKWLMLGNIITLTTASSAGSSNTVSATGSPYLKYLYFQVLTNTGSVTNLYYGLL